MSNTIRRGMLPGPERIRLSADETRRYRDAILNYKRAVENAGVVLKRLEDALGYLQSGNGDNSHLVTPQEDSAGHYLATLFAALYAWIDGYSAPCHATDDVREVVRRWLCEADQDGPRNVRAEGAE